MRSVLRSAGLVFFLLACATAGRGASPSLTQAQASAVQDVAPDDFCVTSGTMRPQADGRSLVESAKMRALVERVTGNAVELHFTYLGPTRKFMALSSGEARTQVGLKLFAHDACNLVYVMWRQLPKPGIVVSTKRNLGMQQSSECDNHGYTNVRAAKELAVPPIATGVPHRLRVERTGAALWVYADEILAWQGRLPVALPDDLAGLTGVRSDNGRYIFKLKLSEEAYQPKWLGRKPTCAASRPSPEE